MVSCGTVEKQSCAVASDASGWVALANGSDLDQWNQIGSARWMTRMIPDGDGEVPVIYGLNTDPKANSYLVHRVPYADFEYVVEFRVAPDVNSGILVRIPTGTEMRFSSTGYEIQVCDSDEHFPTGSVYNIEPAPKGLQRVGEWNEVRVVCRDNKIQTWVNGQRAVEVDHERTAQGHFGFQVHGNPVDRCPPVEIKNPRVRALR